LVIATGSQGEIRAASAQLSRGKYMGLELEDGDTFVFSSKTIPGNEIAVNRVINNLSNKGVVVKYSEDRQFHVSGHTNIPEMMDFYKKIKPPLVIPMHGEIRHLIGHKRVLAEKNIRAEIVRNGEIIEIDKDLKIKKDATNRPEKLFLDGKIIAKSDNIAFRERSRMSSQGFLVLQIGYKKSMKQLTVQFSSFGLPRFGDYLDELKTNTEALLNNMAKKKGKYNLDEFERFVKEDIFSISGKKPIIKIAEME
jgi:ribonuclease J